jgi:hypothetical protein
MYIKNSSQPAEKAIKSSATKKPAVTEKPAVKPAVTENPQESEEEEFSEEEEESSGDDRSTWSCDTCKNTQRLDNGSVCDNCVCEKCGSDKSPGRVGVCISCATYPDWESEMN